MQSSSELVGSISNGKSAYKENHNYSVFETRGPNVFLAPPAASRAYISQLIRACTWSSNWAESEKSPLQHFII